MYTHRHEYSIVTADKFSWLAKTKTLPQWSGPLSRLIIVGYGDVIKVNGLYW